MFAKVHAIVSCLGLYVQYVKRSQHAVVSCLGLYVQYVKCSQHAVVSCLGLYVQYVKRSQHAVVSCLGLYVQYVKRSQRAIVYVQHVKFSEYKLVRYFYLASTSTSPLCRIINRPVQKGYKHEIVHYKLILF
jgi:hypothetical protein